MAVIWQVENSIKDKSSKVYGYLQRIMWIIFSWFRILGARLYRQAIKTWSNATMDFWRFVFDCCTFKSNFQIDGNLTRTKFYLKANFQKSMAAFSGQCRLVFYDLVLFSVPDCTERQQKNTVKCGHGSLKICLWLLHFQLKLWNWR